MAERKDYYGILGVSKDVTKDELKRVFRKLSLKFHPDRQSGKSDKEKEEAEAKFKEIAEAYEVLSDDKKRAEYDNPQSQFDFHSSGGSNFGGMNMDDILRHFGFGDFGFSSRHQQPTRGTNLRIHLRISLEDVLNGCDKEIKLKRYEPCSHCGGSGMTEKSKRRTCKTCGGTGMAFSTNGFMSMQQTCPTCGGRGFIIENPCPHCNGHGIVLNNNSQIKFSIPKGVENGMTIEYGGLGNAAPRGKGENGSLIVIVEYENHPIFDVNGRDLICNLDVQAIDAILGCEIEATTLGGTKIKVKIPQGTDSGKMFRFKGYGLPSYKGGTSLNGNMIGVVNILTPKKLNDNEKRLLEELKKEEHFK